MPPALFSIMDFNIIILVTIHKFIEPGGGAFDSTKQESWCIAKFPRGSRGARIILELTWYKLRKPKKSSRPKIYTYINMA